MPRSFDVHQEFAASAQRVRAMMTDPSYIRERAERTGSISVTVDVRSRTDEASGADTTHVEITRVLPTSGAPAFASALLGESITVTESQHWGPPTPAGCRATMDAAFGSLLRLQATITLTDAGSSSTAVTSATCKASVPLVGGKVEALVEQQVRDYLGYEVQLAAGWLAGHA